MMTTSPIWAAGGGVDTMRVRENPMKLRKNKRMLFISIEVDVDDGRCGGERTYRYLTVRSHTRRQKMHQFSKVIQLSNQSTTNAGGNLYLFQLVDAFWLLV